MSAARLTIMISILAAGLLSATGQAQDVIAEVKAANSSLEMALRSGDLAQLARVLTPQFVWIHGTGSRMSREQLLNSSAQGPRYVSVEDDEVNVVVYGDAAVLTERSKRQYTKDSTPFFSRFTIVYVKQNGSWRAASMHSSQLQLNGEPLPSDRVMPPGSTPQPTAKKK
jgi:ketosteroid isomerase-like protein